MEHYEKIARILRADKDVVQAIDQRLGSYAKKHGAMEEIGTQNEEQMKKRLATLGIPHATTARKIYNALIARVANDNDRLAKAMGNPACGTIHGCLVINGFLEKVMPHRSGWFLKKEKFLSLLEKHPPKKIMEALGYSDMSAMLGKEDWKEIAAALRFLEGNAWINTELLPDYETLTPDDFEERQIELIALGEKWQKAAEQFVQKKYHNISHLKELGIIFIIPTDLHFEGELIRTVSLLGHYLNEVPFYSDLFRRASKDPATFTKKLIALLRGDVIDDRSLIREGDWMIVQRYLAKDDENDWRLFEPHVNPEAIHWERAEHIISDLGKECGIEDLAFWENLNWIGDYYPTDTGIEVLVSFNLVDTAMSLVQQRELVKYLYHHQEALWNKIFSFYIGEEGAEELIKEHIVEGIIRLE